MTAPRDPELLLAAWHGQAHDGLKLRFLSTTWQATTNQAKYWSKLLKEQNLVVCRGKRWYLSVDGWLRLEGIEVV